MQMPKNDGQKSCGGWTDEMRRAVAVKLLIRSYDRRVADV